MSSRARPSGRRLSEADASLVKGMDARGDRHHDIAAWFGVNQGRIAEVIGGSKFGWVPVASTDTLPPPGPYSSGRAAHHAVRALEEAKSALELAITNIDQALKQVKQFG
ncbi:hypothetical protein QA646_09280 [Rhizobium sp. CB3090]|uniref:hypothetical protein n=1 Tax=Rhizobium sp. CB3090 TaxID=3039156 RepID=UPI0024B1DFBD|nr:hypothetical protein [Rhizobium sp. CB3090]WFU11002.1 hypothetical protein QA646_09280 [Rhizobium sp. CB3090]